MGTPFDVGAGIAGIIGLSFTAFQGCIKAFLLISSARSMGEDVNRIRALLEWEQHRLMQWGTRAGVDTGGTPDKRLNWTLIFDLLKQLELLLSDAETLQKRFNLVEDKTPVQSPVQPKGRRGVRRVWAYAKPQMRTERARIIQESASSFKKLRWSTLDQDKIKDLVSEINRFNNCLHQSLATVDQVFFKDALAALLRDLISRTTDPGDLDLIKALLDQNIVAEASSIEAAAGLKKLRLLLKVDQRRDEALDQRSSSTSKSLGATQKGRLPVLAYECLTKLDVPMVTGQSSRQVGRYYSPSKSIDAHVLLEWKTVEKSLENKLLVRIQKLTFLMHNVTDPSFHALSCLGYLCKKSEGSFNQYAYVFKIAGSPQPDVRRPSIRTLASLLTVPTSPSLSYRIRIAHALAETIKQLHTSGWLHKGIRSDNVIFVDYGDQTWETGQSSGPYIAGYEYARADNPLEMTENTPSNAEQNLYRHPETEGDLRSPYRKHFDLFALGCVLLEVALRKKLRTVLRLLADNDGTAQKAQMQSARNSRSQDGFEWEQALRGKTLLLDKEKINLLLDQVAFHAGDVYRSVVHLCFFPETDHIEDEDAEASIDTQIEITKRLSERTL